MTTEYNTFYTWINARHLQINITRYLTKFNY